MPPAQQPRRVGRLARWPRLQALAGWIRRISSPSLRAVHRLRQEQAERLLQPFPDTMPNRHPALFAHARAVLDDLAEPRILSFGCSTGDEPLTLTRYCPRAMIDAIEINPRSLVIARDKAKAQGCKTIAFHLSGDPPETGAYDAIFCLSVLRHGELDAISPERCSEILPFARFDQTLVAFDRVLRTGGYLYLWGSNFRFADSRIAGRYSAIPVPGAPPHQGAIYGPDDRFMHSDGNAFFVFRKERGYPGDDPSAIAKAPQPA